MSNISIQSISPIESNSVEIDSVETLVDYALENIKNENYGVAGEMLTNKKLARELGYSLSESTGIGIPIEAAENETEVIGYSNEIASNAFQGMTRGMMPDPNAITFPKPYLYAASQGTATNLIMKFSEFPKGLAHEIDLIALEEWLHLVQEKTGRPLTNFLDPELDVAYWMIQNGIKMTPAFLARYNRGAMLSRLTSDIQYNPDDLTESPRQFPTLRSGAFINVVRSSGEVEADWQILKFNTRNGNAIVQKGDLVKEIPRRELEAANSKSPATPFYGVNDFRTLFERLNALPDFVVVENGTYLSREEIKSRINQLRSREGNIYEIPTIGGLRALVQQLVSAGL